MKLGQDFKAQYPDEYAGYVAANDEYNRNEEALAKLYVQRDAEAAEAERIRMMEG